MWIYTHTHVVYVYSRHACPPPRLHGTPTDLSILLSLAPFGVACEQ